MDVPTFLFLTSLFIPAAAVLLGVVAVLWPAGLGSRPIAVRDAQPAAQH